MINPLDGVFKAWTDRSGSAMYQYNLQIVPSVYKSWGMKAYTNQYAVTENTQKVDIFSSGVPGLFFVYELSPIIVDYSESSQSFTHFLISNAHSIFFYG